MDLFDSKGRPIQSSVAASDWLTGAIASGQHLSGEIDLGDDYAHINLIIPELTSGDLTVYTARESGGLFQALDTTFYSGAGQKNTVAMIGGWRYVKIYSSVAQDAERSFSLRGINI